IGSLPETLKVRAARGWIRRSSTSNSSAIPPTSSSRTSSSVTRPEVLPYSSTTMAMWSFLAWNSLRSACARLDSGTKYGGGGGGGRGRAGGGPAQEGGGGLGWGVAP